MIHKALKRTRQFHRLTQAKLADTLGISRSHLSEIESAKKSVTMDLLERYSEVFKIPASSFLLFSECIEIGQPSFKPASKVLRIMNWIAQDSELEEES